VGFVPASSIFPQFAASATHVLVSILMVKSIHISGFTFAFIDDDSIEFNFFNSVLSTLPNSTLDTNDDAVGMLGYCTPPACHRRYPTYRPLPGIKGIPHTVT